jgi:RimJ/RimL family protein N-acetyltransferase
MLTLQTERTILTPLKEEDFKDIVQMYLEPDSNKFIPPLQDKNAADYQAFLQKKITKNNHPQGHGLWTIRRKGSNEFIGTTNLNILELLQLTHLGAHLVRSAWGKGYATEVLSTLRDYALQILKLTEIHALLDEQNHASKNILAKIGMHYVETIELHGIKAAIYKL